VAIVELIVATTAPNDAKLVQFAEELTASRKKKGLFSIREGLKK
jgi:hypothetical protein